MQSLMNTLRRLASIRGNQRKLRILDLQMPQMPQEFHCRGVEPASFQRGGRFGDFRGLHDLHALPEHNYHN